MRLYLYTIAHRDNYTDGARFQQVATLVDRETALDHAPAACLDNATAVFDAHGNDARPYVERPDEWNATIAVIVTTVDAPHDDAFASL